MDAVRDRQQQSLRILLVEDSADDAELLLDALRGDGFDPKSARVETARAFRAAITNESWDLVLCDHALPQFSAPAALELLQELGQDLPFIIVSGAISDEDAVNAMRAGAHDYVLKNNLARLGVAIERELAEAIHRRERRRAEEALQQAQRLEAVGQLAAGIAHEINTPTQFVSHNLQFLSEAFVELLARIDPEGAEPTTQACEAGPALDLEYLRKEVPKAIDESSRGMEHISSIVRAVGTFAHPGSDASSLTDLNQLVEHTLTMASNETKSVAEVTTDLDPRLPHIPGHAPSLGQAILNLIINAAYAVAEARADRPQTRGRIHVSTRATGDAIEVAVRDNGPGIPVAVQPRIFDLFFTTKPVGQGTGQGLAISHRIVTEQYDGTIAVDSQLDQGTTFTIRLPLATGAAHAN